ncbi:NAD(P)H-dependent flavin oxidoreductase [Acetobacter sp.]|uniref:NAD(P)H-dependent flavin oxidoreductase n=1 Tax=Acetobacter sp. TaxID=440 RepID=UPI0039EA6BC5
MTQLGLDIPVFQAPMAGVSCPELAAAVSNAGGLGSLGLGAMTVVQAREAIQTTRALTGRPFGINVFCHRESVPEAETVTRWLTWLRPEFARFGGEPPSTLRPLYRSFLGHDEMLDMLVEERPAFLSFHFGLPSRAAIDRLHEAGILLAVSVTSPEEAITATDAAMDVLIVQGYEAGGHRGVFDPLAPDRRLGTHVLLAEVQRVSSLPLIAAGGIMTGMDVAAVLKAGAVAAQLGTAFVACDESRASAAWKAALTEEKGRETAIVTILSGRPARGVRGRFAELEARPDCPTPPAYPYAYDAAKQLAALVAASGVTEYDAFWSGIHGRAARALPAGELMARLRQEMAFSLSGDN